MEKDKGICGRIREWGKGERLRPAKRTPDARRRMTAQIRIADPDFDYASGGRNDGS